MPFILNWIFAKNSLPFFALAALSLWAPFWLVSFCRRIEQFLKNLSRHPRRVIVGVTMAHFLFQAIVSLCFYWPQPRVHDEFSYLLAADTFASGRLTNPPPALPVAFESFHILVSPTYMSKYPPGQGLALALGQVLTGKPIVGAWIFQSLAVGALTWCLYGWLVPLWGFIGGLLLVVHPVFFDWGQSFWGGAVAMLGGALVLGAVGRLKERYGVFEIGALAIGAGLLANSRPYEGLVLLVLSLGLFFLLRKKVWLRAQQVQALAMLGGAGLLFVGAMAFYNQAVTGSAFKMPYQLHAETYSVAPNFLWQAPLPVPVYRSPDLEVHHAAFESWQYEDQKKSVSRFFFWVKEKLGTWFQEAFRLRFLIVGLIGLAAGRWTSSLKWLFLSLGIFIVGILQVTFFNLHYTAPAVPLFAVVILMGLERFSHWTWKAKPVGKLVVYSGLVWTLIPGFALFLEDYAHKRVPRMEKALNRSALEAEVVASGGKHLILMPCENHRCGVVANNANLSDSAVVWARELKPEDAEKLLEYFPNRRVWRLLKQEGRYAVVPYKDPT